MGFAKAKRMGNRQRMTTGDVVWCPNRSELFLETAKAFKTMNILAILVNETA